MQDEEQEPQEVLDEEVGCPNQHLLAQPLHDLI